MKVIAKIVTGRPDGVPISKWIKKNEIYTVVKKVTMVFQGSVQAYQLAEIDMTDCYPYLYFAAYRFIPLVEQPEKELENIEELVIT